DGQQDFTETGVQGVTVRLYDAGADHQIGGGDDNHLDTDISNADGFYSFSSILPGTYYLVLDANSFPFNYLPTLQNAGNDISDSDMDATGTTEPFSLVAGQSVQTLDFGLKPLRSSIGDFVWLDLDYDGTQDFGEPGVEGVVVHIYSPGSDGQYGGGDDVLLDTDITNPDGIYAFESLLPGQYYVLVDLATLPFGLLPTHSDIGLDGFDSDMDATGASSIVDIPGGQVITNLDFGVYQTNYDLSLTKTLSPGQSLLVDLNDIVAYDIAVTNEGNTAVYDVKVVDHIPNGLAFANNNQGWILHSPDSASYNIAGPIGPGETSIVSINLRVQYGASGQSMLNTAEIIGAKDSQSNDLTDFDSTPDNSIPTEDDIDTTSIELIPHDPTGWIYCDKTGRIITGGTISVTGPNGIPNSQVFIINDGSSGYYEFFTNGTPGVYTISYSHPNGYPLSLDCAPQPGPVDLTGMPNPYILGVDTVNANYLSDINCASNPYYTSFDIEAGDPVVYHNNLPLACTVISGSVTQDDNYNDQIDGADTRLGGITVYLFDCADLTMPINSTTTNASGQYVFESLLPGDYVVRVAPFLGHRFVSTGVINQSGYSACMTLNWGDSNTSQDFGLYACPTIDAGPDLSHCYSANSSPLSANLSHGTGNFTWAPASGLSNANIENPIASPNATTNYTITFDDGLGCSATDDINITVGSSTPFVANAPYTDQTVQCAPLPSETPVFADFCDPAPVVVADTVITPLACGFIREITWTATNAAGNSASFIQTLTVADTQSPSIAASHPFFGAILHGDTLYADCSMIPSLDSLAFSSFDNCTVPVVNFTETKISGNCPIDGYLELRNCGWTSTDGCGNKSSLNFVVIVTDNNAPVLSPAPPDLLVSCGAIPVAATLTATDNCDTSLTVVFTQTQTADANGCISQIVRTWTVQDDCGNSDIATQTINVTDATPPTLAGVPADQTLSCGAALPAAPIVTATDLCDADVPVSMNQVTTGNPALGCYSIARTWTATDDCGNTATATQTITLLDNTPPSLVGVPADQNYDCSTVVPSAAAVTATDFCDLVVPVIFSENITGNPTTGCFSITRTWSATDDCGNIVTDSQVINIYDNTPPLLNGVPGNLTIDCTTPVPAAAAVTASDLCDAVLPVTLTEATIGTPGAACYTLRRTWTATDDCGNTATATQSIIVRDNQAPVLSATPANVTYTCLANVPAVPTITATDNCDNNVPVLFFTSSVGNANGCSLTIRRIWAAADDCGNSTIWTQTINVNDDEEPSFVTAIPANLIIDCGTPVPAAPAITATDNCDASVAVNLVESYVGDPNSGCYILTRTWTATDDCGNSVSAFQDIMVRDNIAPNFVNLPNNATVNCDSIPGDNVTATDNCDATVTVTHSDAILSSALGCVTQVVRTWTATDDCGNTRIASRTFTVQNTDAPAITIIEPLLLGVQDGDVLHLECNQLPSLTSASAVASADCCGAATVTFHEYANLAECATAGYYAVMQCGWVATDCCGNVDSLFFTGYVEDHTPPTLFGVPASVVLSLGSPLPAVPAVTASDNCDHTVSIGYNAVTTGPASDQTTTRTWTASDDCGNVAIGVQTIRITNDIVAPLIANVPPDITMEGPIANLPGGMDDVTVTDNIDENPTVSYSEQRTGGTCCYVITRTWTATDDFGNTAIAEQRIHVVDTQAPVITGNLVDETETCSLGAVTMPVLSATDNCTTNLALQFHADTLQMNCGYQVIRTWTAKDECGNETAVTQTLTQQDLEGPTIDPSASISEAFYTSQLANSAGGVNLTVGHVIGSDDAWSIGNRTMPKLQGIAADNCASEHALQFKLASILKVNNGCEENWNINFEVLDACGNAANETFTATASFVDDKAPVFASTPQNLTATCGGIPSPAALTANDETSTAQIAFEETESVGCPKVITRTWTATDACGNSAIAEQKITITDQAAPVLANVPASTLAACGNVPAVPTNITATDGCAGTVPVLFHESTTTLSDCSYAITRTWTATDPCSNSIVKQQYIWVADNTAPTIASNVPAELTIACDDNLPAVPALAVSDNCDDSPSVEMVESTQATNDCNYDVLRKWTVLDNCGNASTVAQTIHVRDSTKPSLVNMPDDLTVHCGSIPTAPNVLATDNCDAQVDVYFLETYEAGCPAKIKRTWSAIDNCGNEKQASQIITIVDDEAPVFATVPADLVVNCGEHLPAPATMAAYDICNNSVSINLAVTNTPTPCGDEVLRTWTATDACGNSSQVRQLVSRVDNIAPGAVEPQDLTVNCGELPIAQQPAFHDDCDSNLSIQFQESSTLTSCGEDVLRTWTATDNCGNTTTIDQLIHVTDNLSPKLSYLNPLLTSLHDGDTLTFECNSDVMFQASDVRSFDNCSLAPVQMNIEDLQAGDCTADGYVLAGKFVWTATDACGNTSNLTLNVRVVDNEAPIIELMPSTVVVNCGEAAPDFETPAILGDCNEVSLSFASQNVPTAYGQAIVGTWTATDACGNIATASQTMQVYSIGAAQLVGVPANGSVDLSAGESVPAPAAVSAVDNCSGASLPLSFNETVQQVDGCHTTIERTWSAVGLNGVTVAATQIIEVLDRVVFSANAVADSCQASNGSVSLSPAQLHYAWSNTSINFQGTGASLQGLPAGIYTVTATNANGCTTTSEVVVESVCNCNAAVLKRIIKNDTKCGEEKGKVVIQLIQNHSDYSFTWTPDLGNASPQGQTRTQLPAGHYEVKVQYQDIANCTNTIAFDILDDCPDCSGIFGGLESSVNGPNGSGFVCIPVPNGLSTYYDILIDGEPYTGATALCDPQPAKVYDYAALPNMGKYSVTWKHGNQTFYTLVEDMSGLAAGMNKVDANGNWFDDVATRQLVSFNTLGNYQELTLRHVPTGQVFSLVPSNATVHAGTELKLKNGNHFVNYTNRLTGCSDEILVFVNGTENLSGPGGKGSISANNIMTPDGDGQQDYLMINGLENMPGHTLQVFNALGQLVFKTRHYDNNWGGSWGQNNIPSGTYFFLLEDGKGEHFTGHIQIIR
ncbi:MAG: gliding motility-associated C-terminal domain-containing protein, partial [Saprospiraceae bacterium]|nr:gliding motility-associated C-terminal domain-containing protein [Saprospiraceae bacterium]